MGYLLIALVLLQQDDKKKDLKEACDKMDKLKSYHFSVKVTVGGEEKGTFEGEYFAPEAIHVRTEKGETARNGDKKMMKLKDEEWREAKKLPRKLEGDELTAPHEWVRKIAEMCPALKKEKSGKIGNVTVDIYVYTLAGDNAKKSFESAGMPLWGSMIDWTKTQNGVLFYVGRDDLVYKVEQRFDGKGKDDKKVENQVVIEFSDMGKAKCKLPDDVKEKLGIK